MTTVSQSIKLYFITILLQYTYNFAQEIFSKHLLTVALLRNKTRKKKITTDIYSSY